MSIRRAEPRDFQALGDIERRAAERFAPGDLPPALRGASLPLATLQQAEQAGLLWVAQAGTGEPVGFLMAAPAGDALHIGEVSVLPEHGGRGLGRALIHTAIRHARERRYRALTLTTFDPVPWNRPFYERLGFVVLPASECPAHLVQHLADEQASGLSDRVAMALRLD